MLFLHGGLGNSDYWGNQVPELAKQYEVIVLDSRGHGRSTRDADPYGYDLMSSDVLAVLDYLKIPKVALVGWSDGAIIGLDIATHHPERLSKLYVAVDKLVKDPLGAKPVARFLAASDGIDALGVPYGLAGEDWAAFRKVVADLRAVVQGDDEALDEIDADHAPRDERGEELDAEEVEDMDEAVDRSGDEGEEAVVDRHGLARDLAYELRDRVRDLS